MKMKKAGPLEVIEIPGTPGGCCIVMFHGYGADARDLAPLARFVSAPPSTKWLFPNGPMSVPLGPQVYGRAWFPIDIEALNEAVRAGTHRDLSRETPEGMKKLRESTYQMLSELNVSIPKVIFSGFSQGAMLATSCFLYARDNPRGLAILSGAVLDEKTWAEKAKAKKGLTFYQSHGDRDELLSMEGAQKLEKLLLEGGLKGKLQTFHGGHEIPQEVLHGLSNYLKPLLVP